MPDLGALVDSSMNKVASIEDRINGSTFGRVFRLDGSGHVSQTVLSLHSQAKAGKVRAGT